VRPPAPSGDAAIVASHLRSFARGVLVFGPEERDDSLCDAVRRTADALGWPVLADPASGLRAGLCCEGALVSSADLLLREPLAAEALRPDLIVRFGGVPTSAAIAGWLTRHASAQLWLVDPSDGLRDPQHRASRVWRLTATDFCRAAAESGAPSDAALQWRARWAQLDSVARSALDGALAAEPRFMTPHLARLLWERLPHEAVLYVANSMPIRDLDAFAGPRGPALTVLANRGVNGIDGLVSAALGAADASGRPTVLWCGDLALLHDVSGLLAGRLQGADLTVVVSNDDGGGIFEYLPVARAVPRAVFERFFAVSHGLDLCELARGLGWTATRVDTADALAAAVSASLEGGLHLIELTVDRAASTALHRRIHAAVAARLREAVER